MRDTGKVVEHRAAWSWREWIDGADGFWNEVVERCRHAVEPAVFWECAPLAARRRGERAALDESIRYVLLPARRLAGVRADPAPFARHLRNGRGQPEAAAFRSLGRDAWLVAPTAEREEATYAHLATFCRGASTAQVDAVGMRLREAFFAAASEHAGPLWLSTSGLGVHWLHVRIDTRPKYYSHTPYRRRS